jgi:hypothetical protein
MNTMKDYDTLQRLYVFDDSEEVAAGVGGHDTYWGEEGEVHILGLWGVALELAEEVKMWREKYDN